MRLWRRRPGTRFGAAGSAITVVEFTAQGWRAVEGPLASGGLRPWHHVQVSTPSVGLRCLFESGVSYNANGQPRLLRDLGGGYFLVHQPGTKGWGDRLNPSVYYPASLHLLRRDRDTWYEIAEVAPLGKGQRKAAEAALCALAPA